MNIANFEKIKENYLLKWMISFMIQIFLIWTHFVSRMNYGSLYQWVEILIFKSHMFSCFLNFAAFVYINDRMKQIEIENFDFEQKCNNIISMIDISNNWSNRFLIFQLVSETMLISIFKSFGFFDLLLTGILLSAGYYLMQYFITLSNH